MEEHPGGANGDAPGLTVGQAAARAGLSAREVQRAIQAGELPAHEAAGPSGRQYVVRQDDLNRYLAARRGASATPSRSRARHILAGAAWRSGRLPLSPLVLGLLCVALALLLALILRGLGSRSGRAGAPPTPTAAAHAHATAVAHAHATATPPLRGTATPANLPTATPHARARSTATPSSAGVASPCRSSTTCRGGGTGTPARSGATTTTSFTVVLNRRGDDNPITIRGQMQLREGLVPLIKQLYLGCGGAEAKHGVPVVQNTVHIDATASLPADTVTRLQRWAAAYGALIGGDDPRVTDVVGDDPHENAEGDGAGLWRELRAALGPEYVVRSLHTQHDNALQIQPRDVCLDSGGVAKKRHSNTSRGRQVTPPRGVASATPQTAGIPRRAGSAACVAADRALAALLRSMTHGAVDPAVLRSRVTRQRQVCTGGIPSLPSALRGDRAARRAYRDAAAARRGVQSIWPLVQAAESGNTNARDVTRAAQVLVTAAAAYAAYARLLGTVNSSR